MLVAGFGTCYVLSLCQRRALTTMLEFQTCTWLCPRAFRAIQGNSAFSWDPSTAGRVVARQQATGTTCLYVIQWMDEIPHHFETMGNHCLLTFAGESWCEMDFVHPQYMYTYNVCVHTVYVTQGPAFHPCTRCQSCTRRVQGPCKPNQTT